MKRVWSPLAIERVQEIADYIALDSPRAAASWIDAIFEKVGILKSSPAIGRTVTEISRPDIRELIFGNYRIVYQLSEKQIAILTVRNFKQILPAKGTGL